MDFGYISKSFSLIVCDGPPGNSKGGRYGLLPIFGDRMTPETRILLDDADRPGEQEVLDRWKQEAHLNVEMRKAPNGSFAIVSSSGSERP